MGKVVTIGEAMVMFVAEEEGELKNVSKYKRFIAGAEANVSIGLSRLGHEVEYITHLGKDPFGEYIFEHLRKENINISRIQFSLDNQTGFQIKSKENKKDPEIVYFRKNSAASKISADSIKNISFKDVDVLHITGVFIALSNNTYKASQYLIKKAKKENTLITFDPNIRKELWDSKERMIERINKVAQEADYVLPGLIEGNILTGLSDVQKISDYYLERGVKGVIIKDGSKDIYAKWIENNKLNEETVPSFKLRRVIDTVGAGDGFAVGVISGLMENLPMLKILERASAIGAIQVSHISDNENLPNKQQLKRFIKEQSS